MKDPAKSLRHSPPHHTAEQTRIPLVHLDTTSYSLQCAIGVSLGSVVEDEGSAERDTFRGTQRSPCVCSAKWTTLANGYRSTPSSSKYFKCCLQAIRDSLSSRMQRLIDPTEPGIAPAALCPYHDHRTRNVSLRVDDKASNAFPDGRSAHPKKGSRQYPQRPAAI